MGPTASGKTAMALRLHGLLPVEIVNADSSLVYRGMDIGTAKPTRAELERAPHRLIDIRDPAQTYSAAEFRVDARREIERILAAGRIPLLVGGTMFYFHALEFGLSELPSAHPALRRALVAQAAAVGWPVLHAQLAERDAAVAARISPQDGQRIQRALEIMAVTGRPASEVMAASPPESAPYRFLKVALIPRDRAALHRRIEQRFRLMLERGLVAEVESLYRRGDLHPGLPSVRMVGYRQVWQCLTGEINYNQMLDQAVAATRQLAKRQLTWLRRYPKVQNFDPESPDRFEGVRAYFARAHESGG
jgi:tRNA dimethylallyltransferase